MKHTQAQREKILREYKAEYERVNGKAVDITRRGSWYQVGTGWQRYRLSDLEKMAGRLRERLSFGV